MIFIHIILCPPYKENLKKLVYYTVYLRILITTQYVVPKKPIHTIQVELELGLGFGF